MYGVQGNNRGVPGVFDRVSAEDAWEVRGILGLLFLSVVSIYSRNELTSSGERGPDQTDGHEGIEAARAQVTELVM
jgi:hypothetical protein